MNWIRRKLPPSTPASVLTVSVLARPGDALEQHVAAGQEGDEQALEHRVLADDHALELIQRLLEARARVLEEGGVLLAHSDGAVVPAPSDSEPEPEPRAAVAVALRAVLAVGPLLGLLLVLDEAGLLRRGRGAGAAATAAAASSPAASAAGTPMPRAPAASTSSERLAELGCGRHEGPPLGVGPCASQARPRFVSCA